MATTLVYQGGPLGTPSSGDLSNCTGGGSSPIQSATVTYTVADFLAMGGIGPIATFGYQGGGAAYTVGATGKLVQGANETGTYAVVAETAGDPTDISITPGTRYIKGQSATLAPDVGQDGDGNASIQIETVDTSAMTAHIPAPGVGKFVDFLRSFAWKSAGTVGLEGGSDLYAAWGRDIVDGDINNTRCGSVIAPFQGNKIDVAVINDPDDGKVYAIIGNKFSANTTAGFDSTLIENKGVYLNTDNTPFDVTEGADMEITVAMDYAIRELP